MLIAALLLGLITARSFGDNAVGLAELGFPIFEAQIDKKNKLQTASNHSHRFCHIYKQTFFSGSVLRRKRSDYMKPTHVKASACLVRHLDTARPFAAAVY